VLDWCSSEDDEVVVHMENRRDHPDLDARPTWFEGSAAGVTRPNGTAEVHARPRTSRGEPDGLPGAGEAR
jgi:hypothetical protein